MSQTTYDCKVTIAQPEEVGEILAFYQQHRTQAVYLRKEEDIRRSVENELFAITRNNDGQIIAASGVYILADGQRIECIGNGSPQYGVVAELGSVLRWRDGLPNSPEGVWHPFLFSIPMILLAQKVGKGPNQIDVDFLVADVQTNLTSTLARLMGQVDLTPLNWKLITEGSGLVGAFEKTVDDSDKESRERKKHFLKGDIGNLPKVAAYLRKCIRLGYLTNRQGDKLRIDMRDLVEKWTVNPNRNVGEVRLTILDRMVANDTALRNSSHNNWCELPNIFENVATLRGQPLRVAANSDYHGSPVTLIAEAGKVVTGGSGGGAAGGGSPTMPGGQRMTGSPSALAAS